MFAVVKGLAIRWRIRWEVVESVVYLQVDGCDELLLVMEDAKV